MTLPTPTEPHRHGAAPDITLHTSAHHAAKPKPARSVLAWPAWLRVVLVLPAVLALWLAVWWANEGVGLW